MEQKLNRRVQKPVYFGPRDSDVWCYAQQIVNFSQWVKDKLRQEMNSDPLDTFAADYISQLVRAKIIPYSANGSTVVKDTKPITNPEDIDKDLDQFF